ncbi:MAG: glycosyltransferase [Acidobacteriota bacterium]
MTIPRTLLVTHYPPGMRNGSMVHVLAAIEAFGDQLVWFSTKSPASLDGGRRDPAEVPMPPIPWACGHVPTRPSREPFRSWRIHAVLGPWAHKLGRDAALFGREHGVELVWGEMSLEAVTAARVAAERLGVPLAVTAFDDPPTLLRHRGYRAYTRRAFERSYQRSLAAASSVGVISDAMAADYRRRYGVDADVLYVGVDPDAVLEAPTSAPDPTSTVTIGSVGSIVSEANWWTLIEALDRLDRDGSNPHLRILHVGPLPERFHHPRVDSTGWVSGEAYRRAVARFDLCFLNLWFEPELAYWSATAFPTKLTTFLESQRPVIAFGPVDASVIRWVGEQGIGAVCPTPDAGALAETIRALVLDEQRYCDTIAAMRDMASTVSRPRYVEAVAAFLDRALIDRAKG